MVKFIEAVPGVVATYLKALYQIRPAGLRRRRRTHSHLLADQDAVTLATGLPHPLEDVLSALSAELLLVNPAGVTITERTA